MISKAVWQRAISPYQRPDPRRALGQIANSFLPYFALWAAMVWSLQISYFLTLGLAVVAAGFLVRIFIISHDCGHGSFLQSRNANNWVGYPGAMLTFTPYFYWNHLHALHHATAGNLDRRGLGDVWTLTLREYQEASFWTRLSYRVVRSPFLMFGVGPLYMFLIHNRFAQPGAGWRWHRSVLLSNLAIATLVTVLVLTLGLKTYLMIQFPTILFAGVGGIWLFYIQHQFEDVYWDRQADWDYLRVALQGCSYFKLPKVLQWFSGNIGFHHIHHLSPRVPNYFLERCHRENAFLHKVRTIGLRDSLRTLNYRVWDEKSRRMVSLGPAYL